MTLRITALIFLAAISFTACKKERPNVIPQQTHQHDHDHDDDHEKMGKFEMHFANMVGDAALQLNTESYTAHGGSTFKVSKFNYYISNIVFTKMDGTTYAEPESYHLIEQDKASSQTFTISDIPSAHYTSVSFIIGVDAARNTSGAQSGALDPIHGMFWSWNTGYIMAKFEGESPDAPNDNTLMYHIGGFEGSNSALRTVSFTFDEHKVVEDNTLHIKFNADVKKWFHGAHHIDFAATPKAHMPGELSKKIADNYANMFSLN